MRDQHLSIYSLSWRTTLLLQNHSTSLETIYKPTVYITCTNLPNVKDLQRIPEVSKESQERKSSLLCMLLMANWNFIMQLHKTTFKVLYSDLPMTCFYFFLFPNLFSGSKGSLLKIWGRKNERQCEQQQKNQCFKSFILPVFANHSTNEGIVWNQ